MLLILVCTPCLTSGVIVGLTSLVPGLSGALNLAGGLCCLLLPEGLAMEVIEEDEGAGCHTRVRRNVSFSASSCQVHHPCSS